MNPLIWEQIYHFIIMLYGGIAVGILHWTWRVIQKKWKSGPVITFIQDLLFWILTGFLICAFLYYSSYGKITVHGTAAFFIGLLFWQILFGEKFHNIFTDIYGIIKQVIPSRGDRENGTKEKRKKHSKRRYRY